MPDEEGEQSASRGYVLGQLSRAFFASVSNEDPEIRQRASKKVVDWIGVFEGMLSGALKIGSRKPTDAPVWATPKIIKGGFATNELLAGGELQSHELEILKRLKTEEQIDKPDRTALNSYFLSEEGFAELTTMLKSRCYRVTVPEEGALLVVAWLVENSRADEARLILDQIAPYISQLRFYPIPTEQVERSFADRQLVHLQDIGQTMSDLKAVKPRAQIRMLREAIEIWAPLEDRSIELIIETCDDSWPCQRFPEGWKDRARKLLSDYDETRKKHTLCAKPDRKGESFYILRECISRCVEDSRKLSGKEIGRVRKILIDVKVKRGFPGSAANVALREKQLDQIASPDSFEIAQLLISRLMLLPSEGTLESANDTLSCVTEGESEKFSLRQGLDIPLRFKEKIARCVDASIEELVANGIISSCEALAKVVPQITSHTRAADFTDMNLRSLYAQIYQSFRKRRSLLLLNLESQIKLEELPWISCLSPFRNEVDAKQESKIAFSKLMETVFVCFPYQILPNKLLTEVKAFSKAAGFSMPLVDELAADIFVGKFSEKFLLSAKCAANVLQGSLYERYYGISYDAVLAIDDVKKEKHGPPVSEKFAEMATEMAGESKDSTSRFVVRNGRIIEQEQILTTHNLALLFSQLDLKNALGSQFHQMPRDTFSWVCKRLSQRQTDHHAALIMIKNSAYAWRQMIFFLSLLEPAEVAVFIGWARELLKTKSTLCQNRLSPILEGLARCAQSPNSVNMDPPGKSSPSRFLGWSTLIDKQGLFAFSADKVCK